MFVDRVDLDLNIFSSCPGLCMLKFQLAAVEELCSTEEAVWSPDDDVIRTHTVMSAARSVNVEAQ